MVLHSPAQALGSQAQQQQQQQPGMYVPHQGASTTAPQASQALYAFSSAWTLGAVVAVAGG